MRSAFYDDLLGRQERLCESHQRESLGPVGGAGRHPARGAAGARLPQGDGSGRDDAGRGGASCTSAIRWPPYVRVVPGGVQGRRGPDHSHGAHAELPTEHRRRSSPTRPRSRRCRSDRECCPPPTPVQAQVAQWRPGEMTIALTDRTPGHAILLVAETLVPGLARGSRREAGSGAPRQLSRRTRRGVPPGAREVRLVFRSAASATGKVVTWISLLAALAAIAAPLARRRRA